MPVDIDLARAETIEYQRDAIASASPRIFTLIQSEMERGRSDFSDAISFGEVPVTVTVDGIEYTARAEIAVSETVRGQTASAIMTVEFTRDLENGSTEVVGAFEVNILDDVRSEDGESLEEVFQRFHNEGDSPEAGPSDLVEGAGNTRRRLF